MTTCGMTPKQCAAVRILAAAGDGKGEAVSVTITINMDRRCRQCGHKGAGRNGLCLKCTGDLFLAKLARERKERGEP